jgi:hypothetical protein
MNDRFKSWLWVVSGVIMILLMIFILSHFGAVIWQFIKMILLSIFVILLLIGGVACIIWGTITLKDESDELH